MEPGFFGVWRYSLSFLLVNFVRERADNSGTDFWPLQQVGLAVKEMQKNFSLSTGQLAEEIQLNLVIVGAEIGRMRGVLLTGNSNSVISWLESGSELYIFPKSGFPIWAVFPPPIEKRMKQLLPYQSLEPTFLVLKKKKAYKKLQRFSSTIIAQWNDLSIIAHLFLFSFFYLDRLVFSCWGILHCFAGVSLPKFGISFGLELSPS